MARKRKPNLFISNTNKVLILLIFAILLALEYVYLTRMQTSREPASFVPAFDLSSEKCQLSMVQSDGWFCDPDSDWKRRKAIHYAQDQRNQVSDERYLFFQNNWEPTVHCAFERRIGKFGDGGKWICDIHRFKESTESSVLVYSFGSNDDFSFEVAVKKNLPEAEIHTFDTGLYECPTDICTYHRTRIGNGRDGRSESLQMIMEKLGHEHRQIHILKVDIEGSEYDLFEELFRRPKKRRRPIPYIRQILFEIHLGNEYDTEAIQRVHRLFQLFRANNYAIFHKEPNLFSADSCFEYGMIRLNPTFFGP